MEAVEVKGAAMVWGVVMAAVTVTAERNKELAHSTDASKPARVACTHIHIPADNYM